MKFVLKVLVAISTLFYSLAWADIFDEVTHHYADSDGVKIHYVSIGKGPLVVMIHGFPDFWYTWRHQMDALKDKFQVVAIDTRGYNKSDQPKGVENYAVMKHVADVAAVIKHIGAEKATIVGHDFGGAVAWWFAITRPLMTENLVVMNLTHPVGYVRDYEKNNTEYAKNFIKGKATDPDVFFGHPMTADVMAGWVKDPVAKKRYIKAYKRSNFTSMLNYYKANPIAPLQLDKGWINNLPKLKMPVLIFHGLKDQWIHSDGLNNTWDWVDADLTIVTTRNADHGVQHDAKDLVSSTMSWWLGARTK